MLGRLGMLVEKMISSYNNLTEEVFSDKQTGRDGRYKVGKLKKVIKDIVKAETRELFSRLPPPQNW